MPDKRKYTRIQIRHPLTVSGKMPSAGAETGCSGMVLNISPSGVMIETPVPVACKTLVLKAAIGDEEPIEATGEIIYCLPLAVDRYHTGIRMGGSIRHTAQFANKILRCYFA